MRHAKILFSLAVLLISTGACTKHHEKPPIADIPSRGVRVNEGAGRLFFAAPQAGTLYVYDANIATLIFAQPMKINEQFVLDPQFKSMTLNGKPIEKAPKFNHHHSHQLYYVADLSVPRR